MNQCKPFTLKIQPQKVKNDSEDVDDNNNDDINFTVTNTGIIRDNIFGDDDESDEKDMNNINDPSDGKEVVTRGSETTNANDGDEPRQAAATDTRIARNDDNDPSHEKEVVTGGRERTDANDGDTCSPRSKSLSLNIE